MLKNIKFWVLLLAVQIAKRLKYRTLGLAKNNRLHVCVLPNSAHAGPLSWNTRFENTGNMIFTQEYQRIATKSRKR